MITSASFPPREGMGFYIWNLSRYLISQGHSVQIITRGGILRTNCEDVDGITIWRVPFFPAYPFHVHLHGLFMASLIKKVESDVDLFHIHSPLSPEISTSRPVMLTFHSSVPDDVSLTPITSFYTLLMKMQAPISYRIECRQLREATKVNVVSSGAADALHKYPGCPREVGIVWNGVDTHIFTPDWKLSTNEKIVLTVSRLSPGKGLVDLIHAAELIIKRDSSVRFIIAGEGILRRSLEKVILENDLKGNILLLGHVSDQSKLVNLYRTAALFVLPSHHEGLPTVLLEVMSCGKPVIATAVSGALDVVKDGVNGLLVPPHAPDQMAQAILRLLQNPELGKRLGAAARKTIEARYSWHLIGQNYVDQYQQLLYETME